MTKTPISFKEESFNLSGASFHELMNYAFSVCDQFTLTNSRTIRYLYNNPQQEKLLKSLGFWHQGIIHSRHWFYLSVPQNDQLTIHLFTANKDSLKQLLSYYNNLFLGYGMTPRQLWMPEDLCFFKNGKLWLATSSHEEICMAAEVSDFELERLCSFGITETCPDFERISLSNYAVIR